MYAKCNGDDYDYEHDAEQDQVGAATVMLQPLAECGAGPEGLMREEDVESVVADHALEGAEIHLLFLSDFVDDPPLDVEEQTLLMIACVAFARLDEIWGLAVADGTVEVRL